MAATSVAALRALIQQRFPDATPLTGGAQTPGMEVRYDTTVFAIGLLACTWSILSHEIGSASQLI